MLYLIALQSIISGIVFLFRRPRHDSNLMLALFFFLLSLQFVGLIIPGGIKQYIAIGYVPFVFLYGPCIYFYAYSLIKEDFHFRYQDLLHLIPFLLFSMFRIFFWDEEVSLEKMVNVGDEGILNVMFRFGILMHILIYIIVVFIKLLSHKKKLENHFATKSVKLSLNWVVFILIALFLSYTIEILAPYLRTSFKTTNELIFWFYHFNMGMLGYVILIFGLQQPILFPKENKILINASKINNAEKYIHSTLTQELMVEISHTINTYLKESKPFLNPGYNLDIMSNELNLSKARISQTINEIDKKNFYQLINGFRVEEFKNLLADPSKEHITFLGLAHEAGFNSKASFNRVFKEFTGHSPSAYLKQQK